MPTASSPITFQFHKGTIKTTLLLSTFCLPIKFQFHKGTIKTLRCCIGVVRECHFNSIKVRLKQAFFYSSFVVL